MTPYPLRLIEVDLLIARISAHARREKSIRHGHISTLHIWWARRPLAACRAVILASLWPDPVDLAAWARDADAEGVARGPRGQALKPGAGVAILPERFLGEARELLRKWVDDSLAVMQQEDGTEVYSRRRAMSDFSKATFITAKKDPLWLENPANLRTVLLDFIADFADWDNSTNEQFLTLARALTQAAHEAMGGEPGTRPLVVDPFAGGGSIPLEALRVGADAFASDLNPIPVLLNKVVLEYIPKYGQRLADEVRKWGAWIKDEAEKELAEFYPKDAADKQAGTPQATPIAYLWARTILSEAPGQGEIPVEVPLMRSLWLAKKANRRRALRWVRDEKGKVKTQTVEVIYRIDGQAVPTRIKRPVLEIFEPAKESEVEGGTVARGSATCPVTGFTTPVVSVRAQLKKRRGGAADARLFCIVSTREHEQGRFYRLPTKADQEAFDAAARELEKRERADGTERSQAGRAAGMRSAKADGQSVDNPLPVVPNEPLPPPGGLGFRVQPYGMTAWGDLFTPRQLLALTTLARLVREAGAKMAMGGSTLAGGSYSADGVSAESALASADAATLHAARTPVPVSRTEGQADGTTVRADEMTVRTNGTTIQPTRTTVQMSGTGVQPSRMAAGLAHEAPAGDAGGQQRDAGGPDAAHGDPARSTGVAGKGGERAAGTFAEAARADSAEPITAADPGLAEAVQACLATCVARTSNQTSSLSKWNGGRELVDGVFSRQALPMMWDFGELANHFGRGGYWEGAIDWFSAIVAALVNNTTAGTSQRASATEHPLPDDSAAAFVTDPPYYDAVPYSDLSDFFYVWLKRTLPPGFSAAFADQLTPKDEECIVDDAKGKDDAFYQRTMGKAMAEGRRIVQPSGIGIVVFAHKSTAGWESQLAAMIDAGWIITGSWPIDTEMGNRLRAMDSAALASSVHLVCRPRENTDGSVSKGDIGEWREVLAELPRKMQEWMPRLTAEGVVGADAIFACIGPALEIFSRYSRVEKASGEAVTLKEYLEHVWAAVSSEALSTIFRDADAAGLEPDARLTAMWLWTLGGGKPEAKGSSGDGDAETAADADDDDDDEDAGSSGKKPKVKGFVLEFDAARKIAQGLGIDLQKSESIVEVKGETARLLPVAERTRHLFGKEAEADTTTKARKAKKQTKQGNLFAELEAIEAEAANGGGGKFGGLDGGKPGATVLDKVHQAMIFFAAGRGEALKRFLVDDGVGNDVRFWKLAQSFSALYPTGTDEKRWVDGVLARKKGLGF